MKKILLAVCALFVFGAVFAQNGRVDVRKNAVAVPYVKKAQLTGFEEGAEPEAVMQDVLARCKKVEDDCEIYL